MLAKGISDISIYNVANYATTNTHTGSFFTSISLAE
jgi:hypothetical protein